MWGILNKPNQKQALILFFLSTVLGSTLSWAQDYDFREVSDQDVQMTTYAQDSLADAVYLHQSRNTYFTYESNKGWLLVTEIHERIKILTKDGLDYGTKRVVYYNSGKDKEFVSEIRGFTYNLEGGKVKEEKLKKSSIFKTELSDNWTETSITMPMVKEGSVIELRYKLTSPFYKIDDVVIQSDIPSAHYFAKIQIPDYFRYNRLVKGNFQVNPKDYSEGRNLQYSYEQDTNGALTQATKTGTINIIEFVSEYEYKDIEALVEEPYVDNIDNYRYTITYELATVDFPNAPIEKFSNTWEEVIATISESRYFGDQLEKTAYFKDDLATLLADSKGEVEKMNRIYDFVKQRMSWNGRYSKYSRGGLSRAFRDKTGNSGDINLMLIAMLKEARINVRPVLISTRENGIPLFPTLEGFNYVIACVDIADKRYLLDATEKLGAPNMLPIRDLNWYGTLINSNGLTEKITLYPENISQRSTLMTINLDDFGDATGTIKTNFTALEALNFRIAYEGASSQGAAESIMKQYDLTDVTNVEVNNFNDLEKPVMQGFSFEIEEAAEQIGGDLYISPLLFLAMESSPFTLDSRNYPIDYSFPFMHRKIVNVVVPEGYTVAALPAPISLSLPDGMGSFKYNITQAEGRINVMCTITMNNSVIPAFKYELIKEFYNQRVQKENEKIVLTKI